LLLLLWTPLWWPLLLLLLLPPWAGVLLLLLPWSLLLAARSLLRFEPWLGLVAAWWQDCWARLPLGGGR